MTKKLPIPSEPAEGETINPQDYAKGFFDDGLVYHWTEGIKPEHVHFEVQTTRTDIDTCNVHLYNLEASTTNENVQDDAYKKKWFVGPPGPDGFQRKDNQDVFLFRLGYFDHVKLNVESMIM